MVLHNNLVLQINFKKEEVKTKPFFSFLTEVYFLKSERKNDIILEFLQ